MFTIAKSALRPTLTRSLIVPSSHTTSFHTLPVLPYEYNALEPHISEEIMKLHHQKHHQTYVNGLNTAEEAYAKSNSTTEQIALQSALKFNGGEPDYIHDSSSQFPNHSYLEAHGLTYTGHINHSLFWKNLAPANAEGGKIQSGPLKFAIERDFGSVEAFKQIFNTKTAAIQGSGWGWLGYNSSTRGLEVVTTANQDPLISHIPIIGVDIWEHAFYLQYKNLKPDYLKAIWNVINFKEAEQRITEAQ